MSAIETAPTEEAASPGPAIPPPARLETHEANPAWAEESPWCYYSRPATLLVVGGLLVASSAAMGALHLSRRAAIPHALGPVCLSIGLVFLVTGIVWMPVAAQTARHKGLLRAHARKRLAAGSTGPEGCRGEAEAS